MREMDRRLHTETETETDFFYNVSCDGIDT
jgi:hypothetical protein